MRRIKLPSFIGISPYLDRQEYAQLLSKKIVFICNAESTDQISELSVTEKRTSMSLLDPPLTQRGRFQANVLASAIDKEIGINDVELIVSSPLSRAMQTAALVFGTRSDRTIYTNRCFSEKVDSWVDTAREFSECEADHIELRGFHFHETRSRHCIQADGNPMPQSWNLDKGFPFERESTAMDRIKRCWKWLASRKEGIIVVATHSKLLGRENSSYGLFLIDPMASLSTIGNAEAVIVTFVDSDRKLLLLPPPLEPVPSMYAIVVLGQALNRDGTPSEILRDRLHGAVDAFHYLKEADHGNSQSPWVVLSGGDAARVGVSEAQVMRDHLARDHSIPEKLLITESMSMNSCQNAWYVADIVKKLGVRRVTLVTSDYHMPRSLYVFEAVFKHVGLYLVDIAPFPAVSGCAMPPDRMTRAYSEHIYRSMLFEKTVLVTRLEREFLDRHIPNVRIFPLGPQRLEQAVSEISLLIMLHEKKYGFS